jgi:hypothetical protein
MIRAHFLTLVSFVLAPAFAAVTWPEERLLPAFDAPERLEVLDLERQPGAVRLMAASLQGVVNRTRPRIYLIENADEGRETWLKDLTLPFTHHADPLALVLRFRAELKGLVIHDPALPDSINVATTLAGLRDALAVDPALAETLAAAPYELPVLVDLRGKFSNRMEAYRWQYEQLWPQANRRMVVGLSPLRGRQPYGHLRDYAVANRAAVFWLDANDPAERELMVKVFTDAGRGAPYLGWFGDDIRGEFSAVELASQHGIHVSAADWSSNLSVFAGTRTTTRPLSPTPAPALEDKIHVALLFSEGDNLQYNQHRMRVMWDDPARGKVPLNWTSSPLLLDAAPAMLDHYRRTATPNDLLVAGPSSVGYFYVDPWPAEHLRGFLKSTRRYVDGSGMTIPYLLNRVDNRDVPLGRERVAVFREEHAPPGFFESWGEQFGTRQVDGLHASTVRGVGSAGEGRRVLAAERARWDGRSPMFLTLGLFAWKMAPADAVQIVESMGPEFRFVRADHFFALMKQVRPAR